MTVLDLLKLDWTFYGLRAPRFAWAGGGGLLFITLLILGWLWFRVLRERRIHDRIRKHLDAIRAEHPTRPGEGLLVAAYDAVARVPDDLPSLRVLPVARIFHARFRPTPERRRYRRLFTARTAGGPPRTATSCATAQHRPLGLHRGLPLALDDLRPKADG